MIRLSDYLARVSDRAFAYGGLDCCTFMADWLVGRGFADPMADRRGCYASRGEYEAQMQEEGGIVRSCSRRFRAIGLVGRVKDARAGDVCLVRVPVLMGDGATALGATGAICVSGLLRAVVTPDAGLVLARLPVVCAWGLPDA
ncbi:hypothetical protein J4G43_030185 [Bradyrhizobium barranii subsp. barranii]|uniref:DUF6950 domain-containing protein n=1 Tax=Bradyrhizobium barranii subsp. barranii TaxID=2823807 RepID=A0A939S0U5_9BRAD|nr:hypothetical protein [Bradyrhizobium barranii]UEM09009.1 hypothetical protein J4G43_030185 [Bradyrhizobium barranii subsp. barranii]